MSPPHTWGRAWPPRPALAPPFLLLALLGAPIGAAYDTPEGCQATPLAASASDGRTGGLVHLSCQLGSINSKLERTNFSVIPSQATAALTVTCGGGSSSRGTLEPSGFASLVNLEELVIEGCGLESVQRDAFRGLTGLRKLTVRTSGQVPQGGLRLEAGALDHLVNLTHLDLSGNWLSELPVAELCPLASLTHLNLSDNQLVSVFNVSETKVASYCLPALRSLDLSHNELTSLEAASLPARLNNLLLNSNYIRQLGPESLASVKELRELDLSNNQLNHLPPDLLHGLRLHTLSLANNTLSSLAPDSLAGQKQLEQLDLSGNLLVSSFLLPSITRDLFSLIQLDLSSNQIQELPADLLANLPNLQVLRLRSNRLTAVRLPPAVFQLRELDLSRNYLSGLGAADLSPCSSLTLLSLAHNQIESVHPAVFRNTSHLLVLDISHNRLATVPESLKYLISLQTLDIGANFITAFDESPLARMESLWRLQMPANLLRNISHTALASMKSLQILDMSANRIERIERGSFGRNPRLRAIRLDGNRLTEIAGVFTGLAELSWLNVSANAVADFDYTHVPRTLHWLDISHNAIGELGNYFELDDGDMALRYLNAGFNNLKSLAPHNLPDRLETILLNDNKISQVMPYTFFKKAGLAKVDLSVNEIASLGQTPLRLSSNEAGERPTFLLGGNPIICDCDMQWFKSINNNNGDNGANNSLQRYPLIGDLESIYCRLVYTEEQAFIPLVEARNDQFLCSYSTHCFSLCQCCQFDSCDCEMTCPEGCSCYHDNSWTKNIIKCSAIESSSIPDSIPMDATELYLDGNNYATLRSHTFIGRKNLRSLHLNNSNIERIENHTFNGLKSLTSLHLENNNLATLAGQEFATLSNLRELYLQGNQINHIDNATFKGLRSLEVLFLQGNSIIDFPVWELAFNPYLVSIRLAENLWSCDCSFMNSLSNWFKGFGHKVYDADLISCVSNEATGLAGLKLADYQALQPCHTTTTSQMLSSVAKTQVQQRSGVNDYMPMMIAMLASFSLVILLALLTFIFRNSIRVWVHSKYGVRVFDSLESKTTTGVNAGASGGGKLFDAYLSYSPADEAFVRQVLSPELESGGHGYQRYRLCLHHRDLPANTVTSDTVVQAAEAAHRTLVLLSNNFLRTEWGRYDYKSGLLQAVNGGGGGASRKIVFVILGQLEGCLLDPNMRLLIKTNVVLHWGEQLFWEKVKYLLPDAEEAERSAQPQTPSSASSSSSSAASTASSYSSYRSSLHSSSSTVRSSLNSSVRGTNVRGTNTAAVSISQPLAAPVVMNRNVALHI